MPLASVSIPHRQFLQSLGFNPPCSVPAGPCPTAANPNGHRSFGTVEVYGRLSACPPARLSACPPMPRANGDSFSTIHFGGTWTPGYP